MADLDLGPIVLGGNSFGWTSNREDTFGVLDAFVEAGGTTIDTSDLYSSWVPGNTGGESETLIGEWTAERGNRDRVQIIGKVGMWAGRPGLSPDNIRAAVDDSLKRLQTDYFDFYLAHKDDDSVPQEDVVGVFDELVRAGKVRRLGVSNFSADRLRSIVEISRATNAAPFVVAQDKFNLVDRGYATALAPTVAELGLVEIPFYSLASGFLTGKYRPETTVDSPRAQGVTALLDDPKNLALLDTLDRIAAAHDVSVAAVALAWLRSQPTVAAPIAGARTAAQVAPLVESFTLVLDDDELAALDG
ncbi:aldo/keto reductase [Millisia brevis]|uniref:aldo/keto reductase n=1 Tax=Millisia brevis TaxID=264148 RepID=UPI00083447BB|nr:aldo/keto reductase [Millisia brevis]